MQWKIVYNLTTGIVTAVNSRDLQDGEGVLYLDPALCGWANVYPSRYKVVNGTLLERTEWVAEQVQVERVKKLESDLAAIDIQVKGADSQPFEYSGHTFYPDTEFIQGIFSMLPYLPDDYTEQWKTAEKQADGISNVYVTLDKTALAGLAAAYFQVKKNNWAAGEAAKQQLKDDFLGE